MFAKLYDMQKIKEVIEQAVMLLRRNKHLPISYENIREINDGTYFITMIDHKLQNRPELNTPGIFTVAIFKNVYTDFNTIAIDSIANIPSDLPAEKRALLRIAYTIYYKYHNNILNTYKTTGVDKSLWTLNNAWKWYEEL